MKKEISIYAFTQAVTEVPCTKCKALKGQHCFNAKQLVRPHLERMRRYWNKIGKEEFNRRHNNYENLHNMWRAVQ